MANPWYDKPTVRGYSNPDVASALQKCIRRGDERQSVYWAVELDRSGYGKYVWRRLLIITSEDIGLAEPDLPATIRALYETWKELVAARNKHEPERLMLCHAVMLLARAKKSRRVDHALCAHYPNNERLYEIPDVAYDLHTLTGKRMGRGLDHWYSEAAKLENEQYLGPDVFFQDSKAMDDNTEIPLKASTKVKAEETDDQIDGQGAIPF